jgi:UDP-3-O-[3-hydroxymyristoyl] glucosamine N-acyltransferase
MITVNEMAKLVEGIVEGDGNTSIKGIAPLAFAEEGDLTFALSEEELKKAEGTAASCVLTTMEAPRLSKTLLRIKDPKTSITIIYNAMLGLKPPRKGTIHSSAIISKSAKLGKNVSIGPGAVIGDNARIGDNSTIAANCVFGNDVSVGERTYIYPNVTIYDHTVIGNNVIIHSGAVIGSDGYGFIPKDGKIYKVPQMGRVIIEDDVEVGANTCIDRGTFENTVIGKGTKLDNFIQIAHNVKLGKNVLIAAQCGIAGSATVGDNTMMGGQVGVADHANIGKNVKIGAKAGISGTVRDDEILLRNPARSPLEVRKLDSILSLLVKNAKKVKAFIRKLPEE